MKIEKCPFCSSDKVRVDGPYPMTHYSVLCDGCGAIGGVYPTARGAVEAWDRVSKAVQLYDAVMDPRLDDKNFPDHPDYKEAVNEDNS